jgi:glycerophosphoryl diester phosphodiesterase
MQRQLVTAVVSAGVLGLGVLTNGPPAAADTYPGCSAITLFSHRGEQVDGRTENSFGALQTAAVTDSAFETDLRTTKDGKIVLMHDPTIDRTTTGVGSVADLTIAEIRSQPMNDGSVVPYVDAALRILSNNPGASAMLELKPGAMTPTSLRSLRDKIVARGLRGRVVVYSFSRAELLAFKVIAPSMRTSLISDGNEATWTPDRFRVYGGANVHVQARSAAWIARAHRIGLRLIGRDTEDPVAWDASVRAGVAAQILDHTAAYKAWCGDVAATG